MKIVKWEVHPEEELLRRLKRTRLRGFDRSLIYEYATLGIHEMHVGDPWPAQRYFLRKTVQDIIDLAVAFRAIGLDIFHLGGPVAWVDFWTDGMDIEGPPIPLLPPIIEESYEDSGMVPLINDGMHRIAAARRMAKTVNVVYVRNVPLRFPYYAFPTPLGWLDVTEVDHLTSDLERKAYRMPEDHKALFRDFNEQFEGVQKKRENVHESSNR